MTWLKKAGQTEMLFFKLNECVNRKVVLRREYLLIVPEDPAKKQARAVCNGSAPNWALFVLKCIARQHLRNCQVPQFPAFCNVFE
jgi:hypothetical protein